MIYFNIIKQFYCRAFWYFKTDYKKNPSNIDWVINYILKFPAALFRWWITLLIKLLKWISYPKYSGRRRVEPGGRDLSSTSGWIRPSTKTLQEVSKRGTVRSRWGSIGIASIGQEKVAKKLGIKQSLMTTWTTLNFTEQRGKRIKVKVTMSWSRKEEKLSK